MTRAAPRAAPPDALTFNVAGLLSEPFGSVRTYEVDRVQIDPGDGLRLSTPVDGTIRLTRTNRGLIVEGDLRTTLAEECSRCLRPIEIPLELRIEEEALPSIDIASGQPVDPIVEPDVLRLTDHHELELEPVVADAVALATPIAPLCREDCPGLCVICGVELATGPHEHPEDDIDPRLEVLKGFRVDASGEND
jgi:uncharacterized protein